jgi:hypothetical protein
MRTRFNAETVFAINYLRTDLLRKYPATPTARKTPGLAMLGLLLAHAPLGSQAGTNLLLQDT